MHEEPTNVRLGEQITAFIWEVFKIVVISVAIVLPLRYYLVQPFFVSGQSMEPNFEDRDYILVDKISYRLHGAQRGDVVVFRYPLDPSQYFIKRVIGLPGETVQIQNNVVTIFNARYPQGLVLDEDAYLPDSQTTVGMTRIKLDDNEYFVLGDNRLHSSDSRRWGTVNKTLISGRAWLRLWPFNKPHEITSVAYPTPAPEE